MALRAWSVADVRAAEEVAARDLEDGALMQRAATGLASVVTARLETLAAPRVVVLAGSGGNGADALYAAARLARADAAAGVVVVATATTVHEGGRAAVEEAGVEILDASHADGFAAAAEALAEADLVVDGMLGLAGRPGLAPSGAATHTDPGSSDEPAHAHPAWALLEHVPDEAYVLAVDLPSGTDPSGDRVVADAVFADETVTFGVAKGVHVLAGANACGLLTVVDIGVAPTTAPLAERLDHDDAAASWPRPFPDDDKYSRGVLGVVAGGENYTGAALLTTTAAVCAGAGMVRYVGGPTPTSLVRAAVPEAVHGPGKVQAWVVGPGLDPHPDSDDEAGHAQVRSARDALDSKEPCVVDAGALDLLDGPRPAAGARTLLTPHAGELARLLSRLNGTDVTRADVQAAPVEHARRAARLLHATVLLKGSTTYVVAPSDDLPVRAQSDGPSWLATAGSGDVLAGLAGTLLAAGLDPLDAGALAALVHGLAGHEANPGGPVRALDVARAIGPVVATLLRRLDG